jgi:hypothetical protein
MRSFAFFFCLTAVPLLWIGCGSGGGQANGGPCTAQIDCAAGLTCAGGKCAPIDGAGSGGASSGSASTGDIGLTTSASTGSGGVVEDYCKGQGPPILVGDQGGTQATCSGSVAETTFRYALCTCDEYVASNALTTDSFDSAKGPYMTGGKSGSIGINGRVAANNVMNIGGSMWVGSALGVQAGAGAPITAAGELRVNGPLHSGAGVKVSVDAFVAGDIQVDALTVVGKLVVPQGTPVVVTKPESVGSIENAAVTVPLPCACGDKDLVDIAGFVSHYETTNDNAQIKLEAGAYASYQGPTTLTLPCGRFYLTKIAGQGDFTLKVQGRTALFIGSDIAPGGKLTVEVDPAAELDLFLAGTIDASQPLHLGSASAPAKVRVYVGGTKTINLSAEGLFAGNLYAPRADLATSGGAEVFGSVFVHRLAASDKLTIHYDTAVLKAGDSCGSPPPSSCSSCTDCDNQACINGACGQCTDNSQCCSPLVCVQGVCVPEIPPPK